VVNSAAAHAVPTGGINRHVLLGVWVSSAPERVFEGFIGRRFEALADGGKRTVEDTRLRPGEPVLYRIDLAAIGATGDEPVNVELRYVFPPEDDHDGPLFRGAAAELLMNLVRGVPVACE
jgi:hypothetical protein